MKATVLDLRRRMPEVLQALDRNEEVTILYRGKAKAVLVPAQGAEETAAPKQVTDHPAFGMWQDANESADVAQHVRSLRRGRFNDL